MIYFITLFLVVLSFSGNASHSVDARFQATQICPVYVSQKDQSNPEQLMIQPNTYYRIREINKKQPDWLRIEFPDHHTLRWVNVNCGLTQDTSPQNLSICDKAGIADSYVLAVSVQAGFCETYGFEAGKPECTQLSKDSYPANHLTLHGLWPNQESCGQHYGYCGVRPALNHCDYPPLNLSAIIGEDLKKLMPSFYYGSCLERHEWNKHGSCQTLSPDDYFALAMRLVTAVDYSVLGNYLMVHKGEIVKRSTLRDLITQALGSNNTGKVYLGCKNGILVDLFIQLPALIPFDESLESLINKAPNHHYHDSCPSSIRISNFHKESWF